MAATKSKENFGIIPPGLASVVESLARQVIKNRPKDVYAFAADHFEKLLKVRQQQQQQQQQKDESKVKENVIKTKDYIPQVQAIIDNSRPIVYEKLEALRKKNTLEAQLNRTCNLLQDVSACFSTSRRPLSADAATNTVSRSAIGLEAMLSETRNLLVDISSTLPALVNNKQDECLLPPLNIPKSSSSSSKAIIQSNKENNVLTLPQLSPTSFILPPETPKENIPESIKMVIIPDFGEAVVHEPDDNDELLPPLIMDNKQLLQCINEESESIESSIKETTATDVNVNESSNEAKETNITGDGMSDDTDRPFVPELNLDSLQDQTISSFKLTDNDDNDDSTIAAATILQAAIRGFLARRRLARQNNNLVSKKRLYRENAIQQTTTTTTTTTSSFEMLALMHTGEFHDCIAIPLVMEKGATIEEIVDERESPITMMQIIPQFKSNSQE